MLPMLPPSGAAGDGQEPLGTMLKGRPQRWTGWKWVPAVGSRPGKSVAEPPGTRDLSTQERCPAPRSFRHRLQSPDPTVRGSPPIPAPK